MSEDCVELEVYTDKELNYEICSFLMKSGFNSGKIISSSKSLLDSLGEYMTSVRIPWSYEFQDVKEVGYCFLDRLSISDVDDGVSIIFDGEDLVKVVNEEGEKCLIRKRNQNSIFLELEKIDERNLMHLKNEQIRWMFLKGFLIAKREIDIISPWMNFRAVDEDLIKLMTSALDRGVVIKIIYGIEPGKSAENVRRSARSDQVAEYLRSKFKDYQKQLFIKRDNIHYKLVLCDEEFKLEGGFNYLSFDGNYEQDRTRKEGSPFGTNLEEIRYLRKEYFDDIK